MDAKNYIKALNLFVLSDDYRPSLRSYSVGKEFTYATDAHTAIRIPTKELGEDWYSPIGGFPDCLLYTSAPHIPPGHYPFGKYPSPYFF